MKRIAFLLGALILLASMAFAKTHVIAFGKWLPVKWFVTPERTETIKVRSLYIDSKLREFTLGDTHDITDGTLVVRQAFRINDSLPDTEKKVPDWKWQRGGWLFVDRNRGSVTKLNLPDFDPFYSVVSWYRDYAAYCGLTDNGERVVAVVTQIGRKRPLLQKDLGAAEAGAEPDSACPAPKWQKDPARVTFEPQGKAALTVDVHGRPAETPPTSEKEEP